MPSHFFINFRRLIPLIILGVAVLPTPVLAAFDSLEYFQQQLKSLPPSQVSYQFLKMAPHARNSEQKKAFYYSAIDAAKEHGNNDTLCLRLVQIAWMAYGDHDYQLADHFLSMGLAGDLCQLSPPLKGEVFYCQGLCAFRMGDYRAALTRLREAVYLFVDVKSYAQAVGALYDIADVYLVQGNHYYAIESLKEASSLAFNHHVASWKGKVCIKLSLLYDDLQQYEEALKYASMAMDVADVNDRNIRQATFSRMGDIYLKLNQPENARRLFGQAVLLAADSLSIYTLQGKLANADIMQGQYALAQAKAEKNLKFAGTSTDSTLKGKALFLMGEILFAQKKYDSAISFFQKALQEAKPLQLHQVRASVLNQLAASYAAMGDYAQAQLLYEQGLSLCVSHGLRYEQAAICRGLSQLFQNQKDYQKALDFQCQYSEIRDSLFNDGILNQMARMEMKVQALKEQDFIQALRHENAFITHSIEQEKNKQMIFMVIAVVLFFISMIAIRLGYSNYRSHKKLKQKNKELAELNATKDKFFSIIAHDLKAPFNSLLGFSEVLTLHAENKSTKEIMEYSGLVYSAARKLYHLVENLLQWSRAQLGAVPYKPECLHIATQTSNVVSLLKMNAESKDIVLTQRIHPDIVAYGDANHYNTILRNLLSNAIKFSKVGSVISIGAEMEQDHVKVWVSDSGMGMHEEQIRRLFTINQTASENGTLNEKGSGLGLLICKEFVELNKGEIWVESQFGKGSVFNFTLPLYLN